MALLLSDVATGPFCCLGGGPGCGVSLSVNVLGVLPTHHSCTLVNDYFLRRRGSPFSIIEMVFYMAFAVAALLHTQ